MAFEPHPLSGGRQAAIMLKRWHRERHSASALIDLVRGEVLGSTNALSLRYDNA